MSGLGRLIARRLALGLLTVWAASVVIFVATEFLPGDVAQAVLNANAISFGLAAPLIPAAAIALSTIGVNLVVDWFLQQSSSTRGGR